MAKQEIKKVIILISKQALQRLSSDRFVQQAKHKKKFNNEILALAASPRSRPTERIGPFNVSPRGQPKERVVWHFELKKDIMYLFIDDLIYHDGHLTYVDKWDKKVQAKKITLSNYTDYVPFSGLQ